MCLVRSIEGKADEYLSRNLEIHLVRSGPMAIFRIQKTNLKKTTLALFFIDMKSFKIAKLALFFYKMCVKDLNDNPS